LNERFKRYLKIILRLSVTVIALYFVFSKIEFRNILECIRDANLVLLLLALLLFFVSKLIAAFRLNYFFSKVNINISNTINLKLYLLGMFYNLFLPGGIGGDGYKIYLLQKAFKPGTKKVFGAVLVDRISGLIALFILALILLSLIETPIPYNSLAWILIPVVLFASYLFIRWIYSYFINIFWITLLLSLMVQIFQLACALLIFLALGGKNQALTYMLVFLVSSIVAIIPITIGGVGARELTFLYGAQYLAINPDIAVSLSLIFYLITAIVSFTGIIYTFKRFDL